MLTLGQLLHTLPGARYEGHLDPAKVAIHAVTGDSRLVQPGSLFVAVSGGRTDGHQYLPVAVERGAVAALGTLPPQCIAGRG